MSRFWRHIYHAATIVALLLAWAGARAQNVIAVQLSTDGPGQPGCLLRHGVFGNLYRVCPGQEPTLTRFDGSGWAPETRVSLDGELVNEASGLLLYEDADTGLYAVARRGERTSRVSFGRLPHGTGSILHAMLLSPRRLYVETSGGIYACEGSTCSKVASNSSRLLTAGEAGVYYALGRDVYRVGDLKRSVAKLPPGELRARRQGIREAAALVIADTAYFFETTPEGAELVNLGRVAPRAEVYAVGRHLLQAIPGMPFLLKDAGCRGRWNPLLDFEAGVHEDAPAIIADESLSYCASGGQLYLQSQSAVFNLTSAPVQKLPLPLLKGARPFAQLTAERKLLVGTAEGIAVYPDIALAQDGPERWVDSEASLMRYSMPSAALSAGGVFYVATTDGRVIAIDEAKTAVELVDVRRHGSHISRLHGTPKALWGCFDPRPGKNAGVFRLLDGHAPRVYTHDDGLDAIISHVQQSESGAVFGASAGGEHPLYRYRAGSDRWEPVGKPLSAGDQLGRVTDFVVVNDTTFLMASELGLFAYNPAEAYQRLSLPNALWGRPVSAVEGTKEGLWFTVDRVGLVYRANAGDLRIFNGGGKWGAGRFREAGLQVLPDGAAVFSYDDGVYLARPPRVTDIDLEARLVAANNASFALPTRLVDGGRLSVFEGDSIAMRYSVSGHGDAQLDAYFEIDGDVVEPARYRPGMAVFAPMPPQRGELKITIMQAGRVRIAAATVRFDVLPYWYKTPGGLAVGLLISFCLFGVVAYGVFLRQQRVAQHLERVVAYRTADLHAAQEKSHRASEAKSMFLANMSHELRTPLNAVQGMTALLGETGLDTQQRQYFDALARGGASLSAIVSDILDFSAIDGGKVKPRETRTQLCAVLREVTSSYGVRAHQKNLFFGYSLPADCEVGIDVPKLRGIIGHLLGNAIKFTMSGEVRLDVSLVPSPDPAFHHLVVEVRDTGIGIPEEKREKIFEVFEQVDNSATRRHGGTGLGLAVVKAYVECLNGTIALASEEGVGSCFTATVPLRVEQLAAPPEPTGLPEVTVLARDIRYGRQLVGELADRRVSAVTTDRLELMRLPQALICFVRDAEERSELLATRELKVYVRSGRPFAFVCGALEDLGVVRLDEAGVCLSYPLGESCLRDLIERWTATIQTQAEAKEATRSTRAAAKKPSKFFDLAAECPLKILVAEDNAVNKMLVLTVLRKLGYGAEWAENGAKAVDLFAANHHDLILMDVHMPEMDGIEATRTIRERFEATPPYICALTANASEEGREECEEAGMEAFLSKPLNLDALIAVIRGVPTLAARASAVGAGTAPEASEAGKFS